MLPLLLERLTSGGTVMRNTKITIAEAIGTFILMMGGPGTAVLAGGALDGAAVLAISLGFGFALLIAAYAVGPVSGCHINPAVTLGLALMKKIPASRVPSYILGQVIGAVAGAFTIWGIRKGAFDSFDANPDNFATNLWGQNHGFYNFGAMALTEIVLTAVLVFVVLSTTRKGFPPAAIGISVGITLTLIHLISIPVDNTSVNPVRSLGMAVFAGGDAIEQLWAFIVFPLIGAVVGVLVWLAVDDSSLEDTMLGDSALVGARDSALGMIDLRSGDADGGGGLPSGPGGDAGSASSAGVSSFASTGTATAVASGPYGAGSHALLDDARAMPEGYPIKGNVDSMLYHRTDSRNYGATGAEVWFDTPASAEAAGFSLAATHRSEDEILHPFGPGSHALLDDARAMPEGYPIKGNVDSMLYHRTDSRNYGATGAEVWFDTTASAEAAGFSLAPTHPKA